MTLALNMARTGFDINMDDVDTALRSLLIEKKKEIFTAVERCAEDIETAAVIYCPKDTESLSRSSFLDIYNRHDELICVVGFGGRNVQVNPKSGKATSEYAVDVHEETWVPHNTGTPKFLEKAVQEFQYDAENQIKDYL